MAPRTPPGTRITQLAQRISVATQAARAAFQAFPFGPGTPITPVATTAETEAGPRTWQIPPSWNLIPQPRAEKDEYTPYLLLRGLCRQNSVAAICITRRIEKMQSIKWSIVPRNKKDAERLAPAIAKATAFFNSPDREHTFADWLGLMLRDHFEIDALTVYRQLTNEGTLYSLDVIDGATIKPVLNEVGRVTGYQQVLWGMPRSNYEAMLQDGDPTTAAPLFGVGDEDQPRQLFYLPRYVSIDSPYGRPPIEAVLAEANTGILKRLWELAYFTDGNIPEMFGVVPNDKLSPETIMAAEQQYNDWMSGQMARRRRFKFLPFNMTITATKPFSYDRALDMEMMRMICAAFSITPMEIGYTDNVNKSSSGTQENVSVETGMKPLAEWLKDFFNIILSLDFDLADAQWQWTEGGVSEDKLKVAQADKIYLEDAVLTRDEVRQMRFAEDLSGPAPALADALALTGKPATTTSSSTPFDPTAPAEDTPLVSDQGKAMMLQLMVHHVLGLVEKGQLTDDQALIYLDMVEKKAPKATQGIGFSLLYPEQIAQLADLMAAGATAFTVVNDSARDPLCVHHIGKTYRLSSSADLLPPYHVNCKCRAVADSLVAV